MTADDYASHIEEDSVTLDWNSHALTITIGRLQWNAGNVHGEITVSIDNRTLIEYQRLNCQSASAKRDLVTELRRYDKDLPWHEYLTPALGAAVRVYRSVGRLIDIRTVEDPGPPTWLLEDYWPDIARPSLLFGDSESMKSVFAVAMLTSIASGQPIVGDVTPNVTGPVAFIDFEDDPNLFRYRHKLITQGAGIDESACAPLLYYRPNGPLHQIADALTGHFEREGVVACVIDSRGPAQGGSLSSDDDTNTFFNAIVALGAQTMVIDHLDKATVREGGTAKHSFGSIFTRGRIASSWFVKRNASLGTDTTVTFTEGKWSHGPTRADRSLVVEWKPQAIRIYRRGEVWAAPDTPAGAVGSNAESIYQCLHKDGAATISAIARRTGLAKSSVSRALQNDERFRNFGNMWHAVNLHGDVLQSVGDEPPDRLEPPY